MATLQVLITSSLLSVFVAFLYTLVVVSGQFAKFSKLELPQGVTGPESAAFRGLIFTEGPFTTVTDGRILKWEGPNAGFVDFAYTSPSSLLVVSFKFASGVDVDLLRGDVYFIDASLTYEIRNTSQPGFKPDSTGRFLRYNPLTRQVSVLLSGLSGGGGPAVSRDGTFVLVPERTSNRISKYWLVGRRANTAELLLNTAGNPNKIKQAGRSGEFWVAVSSGFIPPTPLITPQGVRFNSNGVVLQTVSFATQFFNKTISLVQEQNRKLYVCSRATNFIEANRPRPAFPLLFSSSPVSTSYFTTSQSTVHLLLLNPRSIRQREKRETGARGW
ncbi:hypothetical protein L1987_44755 [Smallanthus sonchifolius]|uniref:Uncharacterized protein n=1 Tax=Smallanthus sonchifolius TaxID=185202 RepID=A0ACB9GQZ1_9ASTR|nr:hypothetical protein L1987_44755 [Smallanthus sonchifolius]